MDSRLPQEPQRPRAAEFFAGIGLVNLALQDAGIDVVWANDVEPVKQRLYAANLDSAHYVLGDVRNVVGTDMPDVDLATASFPCTDLSLAGRRRGLAGDQSSMFWEFARVIDEMGERRPTAVLLENVPGFATSHGGRDLSDAIATLNELGYSCDIIQLDARRFIPQSRVRLFVIGTTNPIGGRPVCSSCLRPQYLVDFASRHTNLAIHASPVRPPEISARPLATVVERHPPGSVLWWDAKRSTDFIRSLSPIQATRLDVARSGKRLTWQTAYRRTRHGVAVWEIRSDHIAGCLRTARGGSSKQAVVEAGRGSVRIRWMTAREYARLQGAPDSFVFGDLSTNQVMFGFGDAVCIPAVAWVVKSFIRPLLDQPSRSLTAHAS